MCCGDQRQAMSASVKRVPAFILRPNNDACFGSRLTLDSVVQGDLFQSRDRENAVCN